MINYCYYFYIISLCYLSDLFIMVYCVILKGNYKRKWRKKVSLKSDVSIQILLTFYLIHVLHINLKNNNCQEYALNTWSLACHEKSILWWCCELVPTKMPWHQTYLMHKNNTSVLPYSVYQLTPTWPLKAGQFDWFSFSMGKIHSQLILCKFLHHWEQLLFCKLSGVW